MKTTGRIKHGAFSECGELRFWAYANGSEYWVTCNKFSEMTARALECKKRRYWENPDKFRAARRERPRTDSERNADRIRSKCPNRRAWTRAWAKERKRKSPSFDISCRLRVNLAQALSRYSSGGKSASTEAMIGCTMAEFITHLESKFRDGMSWENRKLWHIDHIIPCAAFDLTKPEEQRKCFHYSNLQPLWARDNLVKNKRIK